MFASSVRVLSLKFAPSGLTKTGYRNFGQVILVVWKFQPCLKPGQIELGRWQEFWFKFPSLNPDVLRSRVDNFIERCEDNLEDDQS